MLIKHFKTCLINMRFRRYALLLLYAFMLLSLLSCGKRTPPLPPVERVPQRVQISGIQSGNRILLQWQMPARNASDGSILNISRVEVYRLAEPLGSPISLSEEEFASRATMMQAFPVSDADFALKKMTYTDPLQFAGQAVRLRYSIRFSNASGQKAAFSNYLLIEPTARVANAPQAMKASVSQESVFLTWSAPGANIDGTKPANILGYNIYRTRDGESSALLNKSPVTENEFSDLFFEFERKYGYVVRTVSLGANGEPIESLDSEALSVTPKDTFPPSAPASITIAAAPGTLSIFFAVNPERDVVGYTIYRSEDGSTPKKSWKKLNDSLLTANTYQDKNVTQGRTYFYYITATDKFGNVSDESEIVSEVAP
jgi:hypothetical protein